MRVLGCSAGTSSANKYKAMVFVVMRNQQLDCRECLWEMSSGGCFCICVEDEVKKTKSFSS